MMKTLTGLSLLLMTFPSFGWMTAALTLTNDHSRRENIHVCEDYNYNLPRDLRGYKDIHLRLENPSPQVILWMKSQKRYKADEYNHVRFAYEDGFIRLLGAKLEDANEYTILNGTDTILNFALTVSDKEDCPAQQEILSFKPEIQSDGQFFVTNAYISVGSKADIRVSMPRATPPLTGWIADDNTGHITTSTGDSRQTTILTHSRMFTSPGSYRFTASLGYGSVISQKHVTIYVEAGKDPAPVEQRHQYSANVTIHMYGISIITLLLIILFRKKLNLSSRLKTMRKWLCGLKEAVQVDDDIAASRSTVYPKEKVTGYKTTDPASNTPLITQAEDNVTINLTASKADHAEYEKNKEDIDKAAQNY